MAGDESTHLLRRAVDCGVEAAADRGVGELVRILDALESGNPVGALAEYERSQLRDPRHGRRGRIAPGNAGRAPVMLRLSSADPPQLGIFPCVSR